MMMRDQVLEAAMRELNRHPSATMAEIASAIGISRATLHRQFVSRDALVHAIADRALDRWAAVHADVGIDVGIDRDDRDAIAAALGRMIDCYVALAEEFGFLLADEFGDPAHAARCEQLVDREVEFYAWAQETGVLRSDLPSRWIAHLVFGFMLAARGALRAGDVAPRGFNELVRSSFMEGMGR